MCWLTSSSYLGSTSLTFRVWWLVGWLEIGLMVSFGRRVIFCLGLMSASSSCASKAAISFM